MTGNTMEEIYEYLEHGHEVEFEYLNKIYIIQTNSINGESYLEIHDCESENKCLYREYISKTPAMPISREKIDIVLNEKCLNGKSFVEAEADIVVTVVY